MLILAHASPAPAHLPRGHSPQRSIRATRYLPRGQALDFWLLDLVGRTTRRLTQLTDQGVLRTFDITPDGKQIVFERSRQNSDIYLIDLPK